MPIGDIIRGEGIESDMSFFLYFKIVLISLIIVLSLFGRGGSARAAIVVASTVIPMWLLVEKINGDSESIKFWKSKKSRESFQQLPLEEDIRRMAEARRGQQVQQAMLESRLKDQIYHTLKEEYNYSEKKIEELKETSEFEELPNQKLAKFLKVAKDLNELKKPDKENDLFIDKVKSAKKEDLSFEEKVLMAVEELEDIYDLREER